jgi:hypothetical protein
MVAHTAAFSHAGLSSSTRMTKQLSRLSSTTDSTNADSDSSLSAEVKYNGLAISGFVSKQSDIAEPFVFSKLFMTTKWDKITAVTDDLPFTRKRLTTPDTVYSGLIDELRYATVSDINEGGTLSEALPGHEAWIAFNVSSSTLTSMADVAIESGIKRVVFAVPVLEEESGADVMFPETTEKLKRAGVDYTIIKFGVNQATRMGEAKFPYRISRGELPLPQAGEILSSDDLMRIISEVIDIPKAFNCVYGVGAGSDVDREILSYMKSQGWPERVQIGLLCGDFMEKAETAYEKEKEAIQNGSSAPRKTKKKAIAGNKFAGFAPI